MYTERVSANPLKKQGLSSGISFHYPLEPGTGRSGIRGGIEGRGRLFDNKNKTKRK